MISPVILASFGVFVFAVEANYLMRPLSTSDYFSEITSQLVPSAEVLASPDDLSTTVVRCAYTNNGKSSTRLCKVPKGEERQKAAACFSLWRQSDNLVVQDCWVNQKFALATQCVPGKCVSDVAVRGVEFCCCFGNECNTQYSAIRE